MRGRFPGVKEKVSNMTAELTAKDRVGIEQLYNSWQKFIREAKEDPAAFELRERNSEFPHTVEDIEELAALSYEEGMVLAEEVYLEVRAINAGVLRGMRMKYPDFDKCLQSSQ